MPIVHITANILRELLVDAKERHTCFEKEQGKPDPDWPAWYALYIVRMLENSTHNVTIEIEQLKEDIKRDLRREAAAEAFSDGPTHPNHEWR